MSRRLLLLTFTFHAAGPSTLGAQAQARSVAEGLRVNVHAGAVRLEDGDNTGIRPGVSASYANNRAFTVFMTYDRAPVDGPHGSFDLRHLDAGLRVHLLGPSHAFVPFALLAYTWRKADLGSIDLLGEVQDVQVHGGGLTLGAGAHYYIAPRFSLELSAKRSGGAMDMVTANNVQFRHDDVAIRDASWRLNAGFSWWAWFLVPR